MAVSRLRPRAPGRYAGTVGAFWFAAALRRPHGAGTVIDLSIAALARPTAPLAWEHHYGIPPRSTCGGDVVQIVQQPLAGWTAPAVGVSYLVAANYFQFTNHFADTWLNPLQSYLLGAALAAWGILYYAAHARTDRAPRPPPVSDLSRAG
jgi:hypothetical protein